MFSLFSPDTLINHIFIKNYITLIDGLCFSSKCWCLAYPIQTKSKQNLTTIVHCFHASEPGQWPRGCPFIGALHFVHLRTVFCWPDDVD
jgi:hypothetical protein